MTTQIKQFSAKGLSATKLRLRKYDLVRRYSIPENTLGGSYSQSSRRCGKSNCHCASAGGHTRWVITFCHKGKKKVEPVPHQWREEVEKQILATQEYLEAIKEVMAINLELLAQTRKELLEKSKKKSKKGSTLLRKRRSFKHVTPM